MHWQLRVAIGAAGMALLLPVVGTAASADSLDESQLRQALLDPMDFPADWAGDSEEAAEERGIGVPRPEERACRTLFDGTARNSAQAAFARSYTGPFVVTSAASYPGTQQAEQMMDTFRRAAEDCETFHVREGSDEAAFTVAYQAGSLNVDGQGDDTAAVRFHRQPEDPGAPEVIAEAVLVRIGEHTVLVAQAGRDDESTGSVEPLISRAVEKLREVSEGGTPTPPADQPGTSEL